MPLHPRPAPHDDRPPHAPPAVRKVSVAGGAFSGLGDPVARGVVKHATLALASRRGDLDGRTRLEVGDALGHVRRVTAWPRPTGADGGETWRLAFVASLGPVLEWASIVAWEVRFAGDQARIGKIAVSDARQLRGKALDAWDATAIAGELNDGAVAASARLTVDPLGWEVRFRVSVDPGAGVARRIERRMSDLLLPVQVVIDAP